MAGRLSFRSNEEKLDGPFATVTRRFSDQDVQSSQWEDRCLADKCDFHENVLHTIAAFVASSQQSTTTFFNSAVRLRNHDDPDYKNPEPNCGGK